MEALLLAHNSDESAVLRLALQRLGFAVRINTDFAQIVSNWQDYTVDIIMLTFPKKELPISTIRQLRAYSEAPMVVICEAQIEESLVSLLEAGVDLVIFRPFSVRVLISQLRALLRRVVGVPLFTMPVLARGDIKLDTSERTVQVNQDSPKRLTQLEFRLLFTLMSNAGQAISSERLVENVWGYSGSGDRDMVRGLVKRLRDKVEPDPKKPCYIVTVAGVGYKIESS